MSARHETREQWLRHAAAGMAPWFEELGVPLPKYRVAIGFTSRGARSNVIGECWTDLCSEDGHYEIFIVPTMDDPYRVADILAHELVHAAVGIPAGHGPEFARVAKGIGLEGKMTATVGGEEFKRRFEPILEQIGDLPHKALRATGGIIIPKPKGKPKPDDKGKGGGIVSSGPKKQGTRLIKAHCPECGYTVRTTQKWLDVAHPVCPDTDCQRHGLPMQIG